jgi:hypothetical protein
VFVPGRYGDARIGVVARVAGDPTGRMVFVSCREQSNTYYELAVWPEERRFRLFRWGNGQRVDLVPMQPSSSIRRGTVPNLLELTCAGDVIEASINGVIVASVQDSTYTYGRASFGTFASNLTADAWFRHLRVVAAAPPPVTALPARGPGSVLLADSFDDPENGFLPRSISNAGQWTRGYEGGRYRLRKVDSEYDLLPVAFLPGVYDDTSLAVTAQLDGPVNDRFVSLECRIQTDNRSLYRLVVTPQSQSARLLRRDDEQLTDLVPSLFSEAIRQGSEPNRIELTCAGSKLIATVNDTRVLEAEDATYRDGSLAIIASAPNATADAWFDDLVVKVP